ncbi:hypothetical protein [Nostoc sp.]
MDRTRTQYLYNTEALSINAITHPTQGMRSPADPMKVHWDLR